MTVDTLFGAVLRQRAADRRLPSAFVSPERDLSFAELQGRVERCAAALLAAGCRPGEVVGITIADELTHLVVTLALLHLGVPQVGLSTHDPPEMRLRLARRLGVARIVVTDPQHALPEHAVTVLLPDGPEPAAAAVRVDALEADPDAAALYFTSSGTTGEAKIVALTQQMIVRRGERRNFAPDERMLMLTTVEDYPAKTGRLYCVHLGLTSVLQSARPAAGESTQAFCARFGVTRLDVGALQAADLAAAEAEGRHLPRGMSVFVSGSRVAARVRAAFAAGGARLYVNYGAREVGQIASTWPDGDGDVPDSVGRPHPWVELEIVDADGTALPAGERGEVRMRSGGVIREYVGDPVATARHFRDGWFYPGDVGSLTAAGLLCIHGRADDMMNLNSIKIFPAEIEQVLEEHPAVKAAAAFAVSSPVHGDIPVAAVELNAAATVDADELLARARERLGVRAPRRVVVVAALPRNAAGKVVKRELVALVEPPR